MGRLKNLYGFPYLVRSEKCDGWGDENGPNQPGAKSREQSSNCREKVRCPSARPRSAEMLFRRERSNDRFKARIASQRVPKRTEPQMTVGHMASRHLCRIPQVD